MQAREQSSFLYTLADVSQFKGLFQGSYLKGYSEPRLAMVGRSNAGKSSLINALLGKTLARTSNQPGKTRAIHFYRWVSGKKIIADMPGYGYARTSKMDRNDWERLISQYFQEDPNLERALMILDARHGPTQSDCDAIQFLSLRNIPVTFVFAKADLLKTQSERASRRKEGQDILKGLGIAEDIFWISSKTNQGVPELVRHLGIDPRAKGSE